MGSDRSFQLTVLGADVEIEAPVGTPLRAARELFETITGPWPSDWESTWAVADAVLGVPPLVAGATLPGRPAPTAGFLLHLSAGPGAGEHRRLLPGPHRIGRPDGPGVTVPVDDPAVSRIHADLVLTEQGTLTLRDLGSLNGTAILRRGEREAVTRTAEFVLPVVLTVGNCVLSFSPAPPATSPRTPDGAGHLHVNRPPRLPVTPEVVDLRWPAGAEPVEPQGFPVLALVVPLAVAGVLALLWSPVSLLLGLASPVLVGGQWWSGRRRRRRETARRQDRVERARTTFRQAHRAALEAEHSWSHERHPGPAELVAHALGGGGLVFVRARSDADHLLVRLGLGDRSAATVVVRHDPRGDDEPHPPPSGWLHDVPITADPRLGPVGVAGPRAQVLGLTRALLWQLAVLESPTELQIVAVGPDWAWTRWLPHESRAPDPLVHAVAEVRRRTPGTGPSVLVVLDHCTRWRGDPRLAEVLREGPARGVHVLALAATTAELPAECRTVVDLTEAEVRTAAGRTSFRPDLVGLDTVTAGARALAPLRDAAAGPGAGLPTDVGLLDLLGPELLAPDVLQEVWAGAGDGLPAVLGAESEGLCVVDLVRDGPHTLVAGTTGSGKSVLLATLVTSLALARGPRDLQFVLVDYKGGAAFGECVRLPHVAGLVTDLDEHLADRVLRSLRAEVHRREEVLASAGVPDVRDLTPGTLPRLVVVVDEFRVLAQEVPDFVDGLVRLATVGRSLGIHLVLATQRPAGVVSPEIRANTDLRIALRVQSRADAEDVVGDPAPLAFTHPGRAALRRGAEPLRPFQTASTRRVPRSALRVTRPGTPPEDAAVDDLPALVAAARAAAQGRLLPAPPWLPALPGIVPAEEVPAVVEGAVLGWGLLDRPDRQRRDLAGWDLAAAQHLLVAGGVRSGRTTLLRRLITAASAVEVEVHVLDAGGGLADLAGTGRIGSVIGLEEVWRAGRLLERLQEEVGRRRAREGRGPRRPVVLAVDGWEAWVAALTTADPAVGPDGLLRLLREAAGLGIRVVVAADRQALTGAVAAAVGAVVLLRTADRTDATLVGVRPADVPRAAPPGRGLLVVDGLAHEVQVATPLPPGRAPDGFSHLGVDPLPARVGLRDLPVEPGTGSPLGLGGDRTGVVLLPPCPVAVVCGPAGSGRTTTLRTLAAGHERSGQAPAIWVRTTPDRVRTSGPGDLLLLDDSSAALPTEAEEELTRALERGARLVAAAEGPELLGAYRGPAALVRTRARAVVLLGRGPLVPAELLGRRPVPSPGRGPGAGFLVVDGVWTPVRVAQPPAPTVTV